jgi:glutamyl-Q tRNA(Asp) synthetase
LGSLFTALASFLDARSRQGLWLLRIDDLDTPRNVPGAAEAILKTLDAFGLHWDKQVAYQSLHQSAYAQALQQLQDHHLLYRCTCSRKSLTDLSHASNAEPVYPAICRLKNQPSPQHYALRLKTEPLSITFADALQGTITENLASQHGDFIVQRKDKVIAYQLAVVIDDHLQNVTHVVRGADLLDSTIKQYYLHQCLNLPSPHYMHVPVITGPQGAKLSKREFAPAINKQNSYQTLFKLLELLKQAPPVELKHERVSTQLHWAIEHWNPNALNQVRSIDVTNYLT